MSYGFAWMLAVAIALVPMAGAAAEAPARTVAEVAMPVPDDVMALPGELRARFKAQVLDRTRAPYLRLERIMVFLFDPAGLGMTYTPDATYTVEQAYRKREANCLSFTLLVLALAREAGLDAEAQYFDEVLTWRQQDANIVQGNHVNAGVRIRQQRYTVDVASDDIIVRGMPERIDDQRLVALYYSNRAMELTLDGEHAAAVPYMAQAMALDQRSATLWSNAGVLRLRNGDEAGADAAFAHALSLDPRHSGALFNLIQSHERHGDAAALERLQRRARKALANNPFHHFLQGHAAETRGDPEAAIAHYRRAIRLQDDEHRFYFAMARAYAQVGDTRHAIRLLEHAQALGGDAQHDRYQRKLDALQARIRH